MLVIEGFQCSFTWPFALGCGGWHVMGVCGRQDSLLVKKGRVNQDPNTPPPLEFMLDSTGPQLLVTPYLADTRFLENIFSSRLKLQVASPRQRDHWVGRNTNTSLPLSSTALDTCSGKTCQVLTKVSRF